MQHRGSVEIDRPIDEVFHLTNENIADWSTIVVEDEPLDDGPTTVGSKFRTVTEENGRRMEFQGVVTRYDPPHASAVYLTGDMFDIDAAYEFEDLAGRTRVTQISAVKGKGLFRWFLLCGGWLMKGSSRRALDKEFANLKKFCEESAAE